MVLEFCEEILDVRMMKITIFCVNYNSYDALKAYLESLEKSKKQFNNNLELTVVIADNSDSIKTIETTYSYKVKQLNTNGNTGYFGGISYGIQNSGESFREDDYTIVSNVDLIVPQEFFLELSRITCDESVGCLAPAIISEVENGNRNPKIMSRPSKKKLQVLRMMFQFPALHKMYSNLIYLKRREKVQNATDGYIYAAHGSFLIFTNAAASFLESMSYPCFLFGEEIFVAENLMRIGLRTYYTSKVKVYDSEHVSTGQMKSKFYYKCNYDAIDMLLKEYFDE